MVSRELIPPRPWRIVWTAFVVILTFALLFPFTGGFAKTTPDRAVTYTVSDPLGTPAWFLVSAFTESLHLSVQTFTLVGAEGLVPMGATRFLVDLEALLGMGFLALLVASLIREA